MRSARAMARRARGAGRSKPKSSDATRSTLFDADPTLAQRPQAQSPLSPACAWAAPSRRCSPSSVSCRTNSTRSTWARVSRLRNARLREGGGRRGHPGGLQPVQPAGGPRALVEKLASRYSPRFGRSTMRIRRSGSSAARRTRSFRRLWHWSTRTTRSCVSSPTLTRRRSPRILMGATIGVPLRADWAETAADWKLDLDELDNALTERTKLH